VIIARIIFVVWCGSLLANCAGQVDLTKYALVKQDGVLRTGQMASTDAAHDGTPPRTVAAGSPASYVGRATENDFDYLQNDLDDARGATDSDGASTHVRRHTMRAAMTVAEPATSSTPSAPPSKFLETLAEDDTENRILKSKTIICRGC
jgi:hypothetical protein